MGILSSILVHTNNSANKPKKGSEIVIGRSKVIGKCLEILISEKQIQYKYLLISQLVPQIQLDR